MRSVRFEGTIEGEGFKRSIIFLCSKHLGMLKFISGRVGSYNILYFLTLQKLEEMVTIVFTICKDNDPVDLPLFFTEE